MNDPEDNRLGYTIRDQLVPRSLAMTLPSVAAQRYGNTDVITDSYGNCCVQTLDDKLNNFLTPVCPVNPRGFAQTLHVRSRCFDASLVIDGGMSFTFNDGTRALLEIHPADALRNVVLDDSDLIVAFKH